LAEDGGFELPPAHLHCDANYYIARHLCASERFSRAPQFVHGTEFLDFTAHESTHRPLPEEIQLCSGEASARSDRRWALRKKLLNTFSETFQSLSTGKKAQLPRLIQESNFSNCFKLVEQSEGTANKEIHMSEQELRSFIDVARAANLPLSTVYFPHSKGDGPETVKIGRHLLVSR
jgi:hypothetical protein